MINQILSHYRIIEKLGAGGMGEVYRAEDITLKRQVALKVLPDVFAADPERLARFQREAEVLASLNHPNIASIYGFEEADGKRFLVLELVEGETLAERIKKGPLPVEEALETTPPSSIPTPILCARAPLDNVVWIKVWTGCIVAIRIDRQLLGDL